MRTVLPGAKNGLKCGSPECDPMRVRQQNLDFGGAVLLRNQIQTQRRIPVPASRTTSWPSLPSTATHGVLPP